MVTGAFVSPVKHKLEQPRATSQQFRSCCSVTQPLRKQPHRRALPLHSPVQIYTTLGASTVLILVCCGSVKKTKKSTSKSTVDVRDFHSEDVSVKQPRGGLRHSPGATTCPRSGAAVKRGAHTSLTSPHAARTPPELTARQPWAASLFSASGLVFTSRAQQRAGGML